MIVKRAYLDNELANVKAFLNTFNLEMADDLDATFYAVSDESSDSIVGTISCSGHIIKDLAVDSNMQGENLSSLLINEMLNYFRNNNIYDYQVYTKPKNLQIFESFGFKKIVSTDKVLLLEGGNQKIEDEIKKIKTQIEFNFGPLDSNVDLACVVMNANPMTIGHEYLIEQASKEHKLVVVLVVEEDKSMFSFEERFGMVYLATRALGNVCVLPSTKYLVSSISFPSYFLDKKDVESEYAKVDALIYQEYFLKQIPFKARYLGTESNVLMNGYNKVLQETLGNHIHIITRIEENGEIVSASKVRNLINNNLIEEALPLIPRSNQGVFLNIAKLKVSHE